MGTRQAVSNWERGSNLPDIETLIRIATTFDESLDRLILGREGDGRMDERIKTNGAQDARGAHGGAGNGKLAEKLIRDGSEGRRARTNMATVAIGCALMTWSCSACL
jgi:transcriptional regulator with XRE-family HTH domain